MSRLQAIIEAYIEYKQTHNEDGLIDKVFRDEIEREVFKDEKQKTLVKGGKK